MKLGDLLKLKDFKHRPVITVGPDEKITSVVEKLVEHDRGALPVCNLEGELVGIITERDIVRKFLTCKEKYTDMKAGDVMTGEVAVGHPEDSISYALSIMKQKRIRHIPVVEEQRVVGMISMRDLLGFQLEEVEAEVRYASLIRRTDYGRTRLI